MELKKGKSRVGLWTVGFLLVAALLFAGYTWISLTWSYSKGERAGYIQKFSRRGWVCKTWEGELAMVAVPGSMPEKFYFSVRDDAVAVQINQAMGRRIVLYYEQHVGVPTNCFGETEYFVKSVKAIE
ncbi:MAG TPA: hypothetical protein VHN12_00965 [Geobacteraceae bacterium]|jgi:hypothetical protein|nr:hypothetical protein [Geobacteraceae bacterium]